MLCESFLMGLASRVLVKYVSVIENMIREREMIEKTTALCQIT
jgi:hypothetical protein